MHRIDQFNLSNLPEKAQQELYDFYLFLKQKYQYKKTKIEEVDETILLSEDNLSEDWNSIEEDEAWKSFQ